MRAKIVCVQFRSRADSTEQEQALIERAVGVYVDVEYLSALDETIDWAHPEVFMRAYQGVVLGGSAEYDFDGNRAESDPARQMTQIFLKRLQTFFEYIFTYDVPTLAVCYGHQLLGAFAGAEVKFDETQKKICSHRLTMLVDKDKHLLFAGVPDSFMAHYGHKDALQQIPEGATLLLDGGGRCKAPALRYRQNIYTTQFHPELRFGDIAERIKMSPGYLPPGVAVEEVFADDSGSNKILENFGKLVAMRVEGL